MKSVASDAAPSSRSSRSLLRLAQAGDPRALSALFTRQKSALRRWARGRLPMWARDGLDTNDLVQEALAHTLRHLRSFDDRGRGALQAYMREAIRNRIKDELRRVGRRPVRAMLDEQLRDRGAGPHQRAEDAEVMRRYKAKLATMSAAEQQLIVGRVELDYTYEQLALATGKATAGAARIAVRRAAMKLAKKMTE